MVWEVNRGVGRLIHDLGGMDVLEGKTVLWRKAYYNMTLHMQYSSQQYQSLLTWLKGTKVSK